MPIFIDHLIITVYISRRNNGYKKLFSLFRNATMIFLFILCSQLSFVQDSSFTSSINLETIEIECIQGVINDNYVTHY